jgi:hypothetical protein
MNNDILAVRHTIHPDVQLNNTYYRHHYGWKVSHRSIVVTGDSELAVTVGTEATIDQISGSIYLYSDES